MTLKLYLLGGFGVVDDSEQARPVRISTRKGRALLGYLAMRPDNRATREQLADLLWSDCVDAQARHSLRQCLLQLRRDLGAVDAEMLILTGDDVTLQSQKIFVDATEFQSLAASDLSDDLRRASALYRGELLEGLSVDVEAFDQWLQSERRRLESSAALVFERLARALSAAGEGAEAIAAAERLVERDPLREDWQRLLIKLYAEHRSPEAALDRAKSLIALLRKELDVGPAPETVSLLEEIKRTPISPPPTSTHLPQGAGLGARRDPLSITPKRRDETRTFGASLHDSTDDDAVHAIPAGAPRAWMLRLIPGGAIAVSLIVVGGLILLPRGEMAPSRTPLSQVPNQSHDSKNPAQPSWRSPLLADAKPDAAALGTQGVYAVAVLPFLVDDVATDQDRDLAARISSDLISDLSRARLIRVISWHTMRQYTGHTGDIAAIGAELGTRYVIEGSLRRQKSSLHVRVALVDARDRLQVWSDGFERDIDDGGAIPDDISRALARRLQMGVLADQGREAARGDGRDHAVAHLLSKGWSAFMQSVSSGTAGPAEAYFSEVLAKDPENASALSGLGAYHTIVAGLRPDRQHSHLVQAQDLLTRAIAKAPFESLPRYYLGRVHKLTGNLTAARELFQQTLELNPSYAPAYAEIGQLIGLSGNFEEGLQHIQYAFRLSPRDPGAALWSLFAGQIAIEQGKDREAIDWLERAVALSPRNSMAQAFLAAAYALAGQESEAAAHVAEVHKVAPSLTGEAIVKRMAGASHGTHQRERLMQGIRAAFASRS
jgi:DNA-binding SARP family transcriptional activator/TolB-like protein